MTSEFDLHAMENRIKSESTNVVLSIQSYRTIDRPYFDKLRAAVTDAIAFYKEEPERPCAVAKDLETVARILRNEATAFEGRTVACMEMADWLDAAHVEFLSGGK